MSEAFSGGRSARRACTPPGAEMIDMYRGPAGARLPEVSARVFIARAEAIALRDALDRAQATGISGWSVNVEYADIEAVVALLLDLDAPRNHFNPV